MEQWLRTVHLTCSSAPQNLLTMESTSPLTTPIDTSTLLHALRMIILIGPIQPKPDWTNPAQACLRQTIFKIPLKPKRAKEPIPVGEKDSVYDGITYLKENPKPIMGALGVLLNGVKIFGVGSPCGFSSKCPNQDPNAPTIYVDAVVAEGHTTDQCGGHADPHNNYHVHSGIGINITSQRKECGLPADIPGQHSQLLGWIFDGYGMYGRYSLGGVVPTDLDSCQGHTHEIDGELVYHYHLPDGFPWTIGCLTGCPVTSDNPRELDITDPKYGCLE